jgi:hypothetical protein
MKDSRYYNTRVPRTRSWRNQPKFDKFLADTDISGLNYLKSQYNREIRDFPNHFDLNDPEVQEEYYAMLKRRAMINDEIEKRYEYGIIPEHEERFDADKGYVVSERGLEYSIAFNENETRYVYNSATFEDSISNDANERPSIYSQYKDWEYWKTNDRKKNNNR